MLKDWRFIILSVLIMVAVVAGFTYIVENPVDKAMSRRVVDFLSGCVYAVDGSVKKVAQSAYIFCPHNMDVVGDLENIKAETESYI